MGCEAHEWRLWVATTSTAFGAGFLIYSTYVTNNLQVVGEQWLNRSYHATHGHYPPPQTITMLWSSLIASKELGKIIGTLMIPWFAERLGRRNGMLLNCIITFVGCFLCGFGFYLPYHGIMIGRLILGVSMICGVSLASLFLIEVAPLRSRGSSGALIQIFRGFAGTTGMVLALPELLGRRQLWTLALVVPALPVAIHFCVLYMCEESPRHIFITEGRELEAARAVRFYQGSARVGAAIGDLRSEKQRIEQQRAFGWRSLVRTGQLWRPLLLCTLALTNRSLAGILIVQSYSTDMFIAAGIPRHAAAHSTVALGVCHLVSAVAVACGVERCGRRPLLIAGNVGCLATLLLVALFTSFADERWARWASVAALAVFMLIYPVVASVSNIVATELCHQKMRAYAFTIGQLSYSVVGLVSTFAYPLLKRAVGLPSSFIPFCLCLIVAICIYAVFLPETRGRTFESVAFSAPPVVAAEQGQPLLLNGDAAHPDLFSDSDSADEETQLV